VKMVTRCPACGTNFRVYDDQLAARGGQVRCGQCATVFDALATLVAEPEAADVETAPEPVRVAPADELAQVEAVVARAVGSAAPPEPEISLTDSEADFDFGPRGEARARLVTALWAFACLAAVVVLTVQVAHAYRGELALLWPGSRPWLGALCRGLRCTIPLPQHADLVSIESSELAAERAAAGVLTLSGVLRNRAHFAQALPSLEITLTDAQDRALARRVLAPRDYLGDRAGRDGVFAAGSELSFRLHIDASGLGASGYRLYVFYR
jgi:predicted Zn finger-like uncharacterized protein